MQGVSISVVSGDSEQLLSSRMGMDDMRQATGATGTGERISDPSVRSMSPDVPTAKELVITYLDDLPATSKLVVELFLYSRDDSSIMALLDTVLRAHNNLARLRVPEEEHFLCRKGDDEHRDVVLQNLASGDLSPWISNGEPEYAQMLLTSTCRISRTLLSLTRPCLRYCSIVAHRTLYVYDNDV